MIFHGINPLKPTGYVMYQQFNIQQLYALPTLYLCVLYLSQKKTATSAAYNIKWLVFITEMKSVYSAVRTGSLNKAVCASSIYLRTNSDLCHLQHKLIAFYNRDEKCLQRGTDWVFKKSSLRFVSGCRLFSSVTLSTGQCTVPCNLYLHCDNSPHISTVQIG